MTKIIKLFMLCTLVFTTFKAFSQEKFSTYKIYSKNYEIQIASKEDNKFDLYVDAKSLDKLHEVGGLLIRQSQHQDFLNAIAEAKLKYEEWIKIAKENNVKDLYKPMNIKSKVDTYFSYGKWQFHYDVDLIFAFNVLESSSGLYYTLTISTGELKSSSNEFMKVDGFYLRFSSPNEIDTFTNEISMQKINDFMNKPKVKDLFKD
jgi:hypothetical protein